MRDSLSELAKSINYDEEPENQKQEEPEDVALIDLANLQRYEMWIALNGDNRFFSWQEIKELDPVEQHDFAILSRIYNREAREWRKQKEAEQKQQREVSEANRAMAKQNKWNP